MRDVTLVTCRTWPELFPSDQLYAQALAARGMQVAVAPWNGPFKPFAEAGAVVLRANWDYHQELPRFRAWLEALDARRVPVFNPTALVRWNLEKGYLLELAARGVRVPATLVLANDAVAVAAALARGGWGRAVLKPVAGASGFNVSLLDNKASVEQIAEFLAAIPHERVLLQDFLPEVTTDGELSCVFFDGAFSHAFLKRPARGDFRTNSQYQGASELAHPPAEVIRQAGDVLARLDVVPLYARVDGVLRDGALLLTELEVNEPGLALNLAPGAAERFADATLARLARVERPRW
jgi:glutathione synthase/RimK-type ligase-like ATP-grasp enzyme